MGPQRRQPDLRIRSGLGLIDGVVNGEGRDRRISSEIGGLPPSSPAVSIDAVCRAIVGRRRDRSLKRTGPVLRSAGSVGEHARPDALQEATGAGRGRTSLKVLQNGLDSGVVKRGTEPIGRQPQLRQTAKMKRPSGVTKERRQSLKRRFNIVGPEHRRRILCDPAADSYENPANLDATGTPCDR